MRQIQAPTTAVIVGSGPAGLMAAAVCARHIGDVRLLELASPASTNAPPEHIHTVLASAWLQLERWHPGLVSQISSMAPVLDWGTELVRETNEGLGARCESGIRTPFCSRTLLQQVLRTRLTGQAAVRLVRLEAPLDPGDWTPNRLAAAAGLSAPPDLVLDATGARAAMIDSEFCSPGQPTRLQAGDPPIRYESWSRREALDAQEIPACFVLRTQDGALTGAMTIPIEGSRRLCSIAATNETTPTPDDCAAALRSSAFGRALGDGREPWTHTGTTVFPGSFMVDIRKPGDWPAGWLPVGDTLGRATPVLGLGLSDAVAMLAVLDDLLAQGRSSSDLTRRYIRSAHSVKRKSFHRARALADLIRSSGQDASIATRVRSHAARSVLRAATRSPSFNEAYLAWRHGLCSPARFAFHPALAASLLKLGQHPENHWISAAEYRTVVREDVDLEPDER